MPRMRNLRGGTIVFLRRHLEMRRKLTVIDMERAAAEEGAKAMGKGKGHGRRPLPTAIRPFAA